ncbi:MAG: glycine--tRNA ligase subunit beta [Thermodesulfobacteriota bacterium]|nr:glycine--tRNA ligase subunit beta [Thermodesulfobacteriota bacterium]
MDNLLLEIGAEEIPAGYIEPALKALSSALQQKMSQARIDYGNIKLYGTPRRLALEVENVAARQKSIKTEMTGPPSRVGFDKTGKPTLAAKKFAEKVGVPINRITIKETKKGSYLCAKKAERGVSSRKLLSSILPEVILSTPFPKTMRWADLSISFARPIHSIVALYGNKIISFALENIKSGRYTYGHSFMNPARVKINGAEDYVETMRSVNVLVDIQQRRKFIEGEIIKVARSAGGKVLEDEELLDIVTNLVEYPVPVLGKFETKFLGLPDEILITAMREHQKYFAVIDKKGKLMPCFIAVNNTITNDMGLVATGHERVIRARLADAQFFYDSDIEVPNEKRVEKLNGVLFQAKLGSMYEKIMRVRGIAEFVAENVDSGLNLKKGDSDLKMQAARAATLCKSDLVSNVVVEFPKLQGVMGRVYAEIAGELPTVCAAIEEHYRPTRSGGVLPETMTGAVLSIADKIDSICGCFSVGLIPTGASDPYALRRQGIGIIQIINDKGFLFSIKSLIDQSLNLLSAKGIKVKDNVAEKVYTFLKNRMAHLLAEKGYSKDVIAAVISASADNVPDVYNRAVVLERLKAEEDFEPLAITFKRVVNIIKKSGNIKTPPKAGEVKQNLFEHESESALLSAYKKVENSVTEKMNQGFFDQALLDIASLRGVVDDFFDGVMVMAENKKIQHNRLALLGCIAALFGKFADFSKIST